MSNMDKSNTAKKTPMGGGPGHGGPMGSMMRGGGEKAKDFKGSMKKLLKRLSRYYGRFIAVIIFAIASTVFTIYGPKLLGQATNRLFEGVVAKLQRIPDAAIDFEYIGNIILLLLALYIVSAIFSLIMGIVMSRVATDIGYEMRKDISKKINNLPLRFFDKTPHGEVLSRITNDVDTITNSLQQSMVQIITSVTTLIGVAIMMLSISLSMTLITLIILPISFAMIMVIVKFSQKQFKLQAASLGKVSSHVEEMYSGHVIMKAFNGEKKSIEEFEKHNNELYQSAWKSQFFSSIMMPLMMFVGNLGYVAVSIQGGILAINGTISVGDIQAFLQYVRSFTQPIAQTAQISNTLQSTAAAAERVFQFLAEEEEVEDIQAPVSIEKIEGYVSFENVQFGYNENEPVIKGFSATIKPGQKVAIVGPTGAGKTTMVKLLMRFYDVNDGSIKVDGHDLREFKRNELRSLFGMVLQDTWLFNGSIEDNLKYGKLDATHEEVEAASKAANVHHFIHTLPGSYTYVLNEEASNISLGQKQLLTIARAFLANPRILILDEATSSVDTRTEVLIQKAMDQLMEGRTSFIIAHRLSTIRNADLILVMKDGNIVEQGTHLGLMAQGGFYQNLYNSQFEESDV
jgi:ATP-binding cassette, subfamily B, multidrug efflux pump